MRALATLSLLTLLFACSDDDRPGADSGGVDSGGTDSGRVDTGAPAPCGGACPAERPMCDEATDTCVGCLGDGDCAGDLTCSGGRCVGCTSNDECTAAAEAACDATAGVCRPCAMDGECSHLGSRSCEAGTCAEPLGLCEPCTTDRECPADAACLRMWHRTTRRDTSYCLPRRDSGGCRSPFTFHIRLRASVDGAPPADYCAPSEHVTTCEALLDHVAEARCDVDADCGADGLDDALCRGMLCTYECATADDCDGDRGCFGSTGGGTGSGPLPDPMGPTYCE